MTPDDHLLASAAAPDGMAAALRGLHARLPALDDPATPEDNLALLRLLHAVARRDLPLARLFEGHVDALQILLRYADPDLAREVRGLAAAEGLFGVWNAALSGEPLRVSEGRLEGGKSFCSGAGVLGHALAGADTAEGNRLVLIDLAASAPAIDRTWWKVIGMQRSQTHRVRWRGAPAGSFRLVGAVGDYAREPWFSGGALRFVACHAGGVAALFDRVRDHLTATERAGDPHQARHLAELYVLAAAAADAVRAAALAWGDAHYVERVAAARVTVTACAERALAIAQQSVGLAGMFVEHPLASVLTDLTVYLRQPLPDAQWAKVGKAAADGVLVPVL